MTDPVLLVIDNDPQELALFEHLLRRRYGADYRVLAERSPEAGIDLLAQLAYRGDDVALVAADLRLPGMDGVKFLERAHALHRGAIRALLVALDSRGTRIPFGELESLQRATTLGRIEFWVVKGWVSPEELLYPHLQEALTVWTRANRPRHEVVRVVGDQRSEYRPVRVLRGGLPQGPSIAARSRRGCTATARGHPPRWVGAA